MYLIIRLDLLCKGRQHEWLYFVSNLHNQTSLLLLLHGLLHLLDLDINIVL